MGFTKHCQLSKHARHDVVHNTTVFVTDAAAGFAGGAVRTDKRGQVGVITLDNQRTRNALSTQTANGIVAGLESLRAEGVRTVVLRAAAGLRVWSAGHDIDELPRGRRDPLGYNDPLEQLLRAVRTFPFPVIASQFGERCGENGGAVARHRPAVRDGRGGTSPLLSEHPRAIAV